MRTVHTVVEIFDSVELQNNIVAALGFRAKCAIFLYEYRQKESLNGVIALLKEKLPDIVIEKVLIETKEARNSMEALLQSLKKEGREVLTEINGGSPIISNYARDCCKKLGLPCIMIDIHSGMVIGVEHGTEWEGSLERPQLTFQDILCLHGRTYNRHMHMLADEIYHDRILKMSEYAFSHPSDFSFFYNYVHHRSNGELSEPGLKIILDKNKEKGVSERIIDIFKLFEREGFIKEFRSNAYQISFTCAEPFVKEMLAVKGSWLEMYIYILAKRSGLFSEVYQSVMIGWDLEKKLQYNVENEIDVVLMKEGTPVFISCKMANPKPDALHEIYALADGFGGAGAVPVLATSSNIRKRNQTLWNRAEEMGVRIADQSVLNREGLLQFFREL